MKLFDVSLNISKRCINQLPLFFDECFNSLNTLPSMLGTNVSLQEQRRLSVVAAPLRLQRRLTLVAAPQR
jgi:hypothetical protein